MQLAPYSSLPTPNNFDPLIKPTWKGYMDVSSMPEAPNSSVTDAWNVAKAIGVGTVASGIVGSMFEQIGRGPIRPPLVPRPARSEDTGISQIVYY